MSEQKNKVDEDLEVDEAMLPVVDFVSQIVDVEGLYEQSGIFNLEMNSATIGMPLQLEILTKESGEVVLGGSPPLYYVDTTFMPVFHHIS